MNKTFLLGLLGLVLLSAACGSKAAPDALKNTRWQLESIDGAAPLAGSQITLEFKEDTLGGNSGCNHYDGEYKIDGDGLKIGAVTMTLMACVDENAMKQENTFQIALGQVQKFSINDDRQLQLLDAAGNVVLVFVKQAE